MMIPAYFVIHALETFILAIYMAAVGSEPDTSVVFGLSVSRLLIVIILFLIAGIFVYLAVKSWPLKSRIRMFFKAGMQNEKTVRIIFLAGIGIVALMLFILTRQIGQFGDFKLIYQRFEPVIVWFGVLGAQNAFLAAIWYCTYYVKSQSQPDYQESLAEMSLLAGVYLVFVMVKLVLVTSTSYGPLGRGDEMTYFDMMDSFYRGFFSVAQSHHYPPLYPLSLLPALVFKGYAFEGIKLLNVLYSSSIIFPIYFIARSFLGRKYSLIAALLTCLIPYHLVFPRRIMSENLFFPMFIWTVLVTFAVPRARRQRLPWDLLNGAMIAILYLTRYISLVAIPCFLAAWWVKPFEGEKSILKPGERKVKHFLWMILVLAIVFSPWLIAGIREDVPVKQVLGFVIASKTDPAQLTAYNLLVWVVLYACYYVLVSAPVLNLLLVTFTQIDFKRWREGLGRLVFQVLVLMGGFYVAVIRHSWRAYYNSVLPSKIMGRYLIVFSVLYIVIAMIVLKKFDRGRIKSPVKMVFWTCALPFLLVIFAYFVLIKGAVFATDGDLLNLMGSVDGFLTEILGPYFFVLLALIYGALTFFLIRDRRKFFMSVLVGGVLVYYLAGMPAYFKDLIIYQTYPWLSKQIAELLPVPDLKDPEAEKISVFMPEGYDSKEQAEIYNGLRVRGIDNTEILAYSEENLERMPTDKGFVIWEIEDPADLPVGQRLYIFNGECFTIEEISR